MFYPLKMDIFRTSWGFLCCSPWVGLPPSLLSPPHPLPSAQSHHSSTSMHFSSGHNGDHMLKRALKPNTGHPPSNKPAVSSGAGLSLRGTKPYLRPPRQHAIQRKPADNAARPVTCFADFWRCLERYASGFCFHPGVFGMNVHSCNMLEPRNTFNKYGEGDGRRDRCGPFTLRRRSNRTMAGNECPLCIGSYVSERY